MLENHTRIFPDFQTKKKKILLNLFRSEFCVFTLMVKDCVHSRGLLSGPTHNPLIGADPDVRADRHPHQSRPQTWHERARFLLLQFPVTNAAGSSWSQLTALRFDRWKRALFLRLDVPTGRSGTPTVQ